MATEELKVKITADTSDYTQKAEQAADATKELGSEAKVAASKMEVLKAKLDQQKASLAVLKEKYEALTTSQKGTSAQVKKLEADMKVLNAEIRLGEANLEAAAAAQKALGNADAKGMSEVGDALRNIKNLQMADVFLNMMNAFSQVKDQFKTAGTGFKQAKEEFKAAFDFKNFDVGDDGFKGIVQSMGIQFKESITSIGQGFKALGKGISAAMKTAAAAIAAAIAVLVAFVATIKNAITASKRLRDTFFEAQKVGMSTAAYEEWAYVLNQVGVETDKLSDFIKSLSAAQNDLRDGSEGMVNAFKTLGLSVEEATSMTQEELFVETIKRLQQMDDAIERTGIAYRIFGEDDAAQVANLLALNNEEMERMINNFYLLGGSASDSAIQKSLELQAALSNMRLAWQGISNTIGEAVMPALTAVVNAIAKAIAWVNMLLRAVFGFDIVAKGSQSVNKASASVGGYSNSLKDAAKSAEQLRRSTMGFDELNVVPSGKSAAGGAGSDYSGGGGGGFEMPEISGLTQDLGLDKWAEHFEKFRAAYQTWVPIALSAIGIALAIIGFCTGNIALGIVGVGLAGLGISIGFQNGLWSKLLKGAINAFKNFGKIIKDALKSVGDFFTKIGKAIADTAKRVWKAAADFVVNTWEKVKTTAINIWNAIKTFLTNCWNGIKSVASTVWNAIKTFFVNLWNGLKSTATTIWNAVAKFFSDTWNSIKTTATNVWNAIKTFLSNLWNGLKTTATTVWNAVSKFFTDTWNNIKTAATNAWNGIKSMLENTWNTIKTKASELCDKLKEFFSKAWDAIKKVWDVVKGYFEDIWNAIKTGATTLTENVKNFFINAWNAIKGVWDTVKGYFSDIWENIKTKASSALESIKGFFSGAWTAIKNVWSGVTTWFGNIWTGIKNAFSGVGDWFGSIFSGAVTKVKNAWNGIKEWFSGVWNGIKGVFTSAGSAISDGITGALKSTFNSFISGAVGLVNKFIRSINSAIDLINKIPGVSIGKLSTLSVPQLAKGGIVTDSILANIGERGREAVLPLENNTGWMDVLADRIAARSGPSKIVLQVDGRELGWATIEQINAITKQTGGLQLVL